MRKRGIRAFRGNKTIAKDHQILNFKETPKLTFNKYEETYKESFPNFVKLFGWANINETLFKGLTSEDSKFRATYEWDAIEWLYFRHVGVTPLVYRFDKVRLNKSFITNFFTYFEPPKDSFRMTEVYHDRDLEMAEFTLMIENDIVMNYDTEDLTFFINPSKHLVPGVNNKFWWLLRLLNQYKKKSSERNKINIVYKGDYGFEKIAFDVKKIDVDLKDNYNDGFEEIAENIIAGLNDKKKSGLYILNGDSGTGKTTFIRYLASKVNRNIIFISPDMVDHITDPAFIPFLMNNGDSILIIEDAEPALEKRSSGTRSGAISNILNLTDGLLSDCLNISIVATFNTKTKVLDEALTRQGRLIYSYTFEKLVIEKSLKLLKKLNKKVKSDITEPMTVAEIYNYGNSNNYTLNYGNKVGFK